MQTEGYLQTRFAAARFGARLGTAFARHRPSIPALCRTLTLAWRAAASKQGASSFICSQARSIGDASFHTTNRSTTVVEDACRRPMPESSKRWSSHVNSKHLWPALTHASIVAFVSLSLLGKTTATGSWWKSRGIQRHIFAMVLSSPYLCGDRQKDDMRTQSGAAIEDDACECTVQILSDDPRRGILTAPTQG